MNSKTTDTDDGPTFITLNEAQEALRCGKTRIYELGEEGRLELRKFGRRTLVTERSVKQVLKDIENTPLARKQDV